MKLAFPTHRAHLEKEVQGAIVDNLRSAVPRLKRRSDKADTVEAQQRSATRRAVQWDAQILGNRENDNGDDF